MRWYDGFAVSLILPAALIAALGYSIGALGAWGAVLLWVLSMLMATVANRIYSEMATMFPDKSGGIALYAYEGWRSRLSLVGPVATFSYWFVWTTAIALFANVMGVLAQTQFFPEQDWTVNLGLLELTFANLFATAVILFVWGINIFGVQPALKVIYVTGAILMVPLFVFIVLPHLTGNWDPSNLTWKLGEVGFWGGLQLAIVWLYVMYYTSGGIEICATFTPEYKRGARDASHALLAAGLFSLVVFALLPIGVTGAVGERAAIDDPVGFYADAFAKILGGGSTIMIAFIIASLLMVIVAAAADASRALYGMARDRMTVKQFDHVNRYGAPDRALHVMLVVNLLLLFFVKDTLAIIATGNLGYVLAHFFAVTGFLLLRKDRPHWPRPLRVGTVYVVAAAVLAFMFLTIAAVGAFSFHITGYGGFRELAISVGILPIGVLLFLVRRLVQDRGKVVLRESVPDRPEDAPGLPSGEDPSTQPSA